MTEAAAAAEELGRSMEQISAGAEEAAGATQEQLGAIKNVAENLAVARREADSSRRLTDATQVLLAEASTQISTSVQAIEKNAERQVATAKVISELERRAQDVSSITGTVSRISDQTNLLALNAAIEAARAGDHGRGFAVVAEEVRALAEVSDKSALEVQGLAEEITSNVRGAVEVINAAATTAIAQSKAGSLVAQELVAVRKDMTALAEGSQDTLTASLEAERAIIEAQKGAELVASAAEEQSSAANEARSAIRQQSVSLDQGQKAAQSLAVLSEQLRSGSAEGSAPEQIASAAEQLSATIQELSSAASEISAAVKQINKGSMQQAAAAQQTSAALAQIEKSARIAQDRSRLASERVAAMESVIVRSRTAVSDLIAGVGDTLEETRGSLATIIQLESVGRKIEKIVDSIALVTIQTSMLAVSGAVEAARAGDAGRGFALVSNDIRGLAREASESLERVKDSVSSILDQISVLRRDLEQLVSAAELEVQNNRAVLKALDNLNTDVASLSAAYQTIGQGAEAILTAAGQTAAAARQIAAAAEEANSASRQAATASAEQAQGADDLAAAIEEIASLSDELKKQHG
ncbi:methyl-accepting chemotaxis protein [Bradyrhizobium liaoningense]|uniref:methyl-accepting chemotaxis protein n=1 Tax=Bradyrhizobium liaoningense TaxID=43992 RepID=UPI002013ABEF|nr:methyl-accepting chemotaxis protein [Bradyrhizobium liaoningense]